MSRLIRMRYNLQVSSLDDSQLNLSIWQTEKWRKKDWLTAFAFNFTLYSENMKCLLDFLKAFFCRLDSLIVDSECARRRAREKEETVKSTDRNFKCIFFWLLMWSNFISIDSILFRSNFTSSSSEWKWDGRSEVAIMAVTRRSPYTICHWNYRYNFKVIFSFCFERFFQTRNFRFLRRIIKVSIFLWLMIFSPSPYSTFLFE